MGSKTHFGVSNHGGSARFRRCEHAEIVDGVHLECFVASTIEGVNRINEIRHSQ